MKNHRLLITIALLAGLPLALNANPTTDRNIEATANGSYTFRQVLDKKVEAKAHDGVVTLTGKVADESHKRIAEDTVSGLDGVTKVDNNIKVEGAEKEGSDGWLALKIRSTLLAKANVSLTNTKVNVVNGMVTLTGTADSQAQKELTEAYIKDVDGVKAVSNQITVVDKAKVEKAEAKAESNADVAAARLKNDRDTVGEKIDDGSITAQIKYELFSHRSTSALKTKVNTINGKVIISGEAGTDAEKSLVTTLAKSVRGVQSVDNNMTVKK